MSLKLKDLIVPEDFDFSAHIKVQGKLETYFETGMECTGLVLYDNTKLIRNPDFDPSKPVSFDNYDFYKDYSGLNFIKNGDLLQVGDGPIWGMFFNEKLAKKDRYHLSFYPMGFTKKQWVNLFVKEDKDATLWVKKK